jgi:hypothetical protein
MNIASSTPSVASANSLSDLFFLHLLHRLRHLELVHLALGNLVDDVRLPSTYGDGEISHFKKVRILIRPPDPNRWIHLLRGTDRGWVLHFFHRIPIRL